VKKLLISLAVFLPLVSFAMDANQMKYVEILPAQAATLIQTNVVLLAPTGLTNNQTTATGGEVTLTAIPGTVLVSVGFGTGIDATYTGRVTVAYGTASGVYTTTNTFTHTGTTAGKVHSVEVNLDTLRGTNAALYALASFSVVCGGAEDTRALASVTLTYGAARADQTITGSAVDKAGYKGNSTLWIQSGAPLNGSSAYTNLVTFQHATASTGTFVTVTNLAGTAAVFTFTGASAKNESYQIDLAKLHKYMRVVAVQKNGAGSVDVTLIAPMKSE